MPPENKLPKRKVFVVDDHPLFRLGITRLLAEEADLEICGEAATAAQALSALRTAKADVVIVDVSLPGTNGIELIKHVRAEHATLPVLVLSVHSESQYALRSLRAGALGYLQKTKAADDLLPALRKVLKGEIAVSDGFGEELIFRVARGKADGATPIDTLSDRELEILSRLGAGDSTKDMAAALNLSVKTVESHRLHIKEKLNLKTSSDLVRFALEWTEWQSAANAGPVEGRNIEPRPLAPSK